MKTFNSTLLKKCRPLLMVFFTFLISDIVIGQITLVTGSPQSAETSSTTLTINKPSGLAVNDVMLVNITQGDDNDGQTLSNATRSGWTLVKGGVIGTNSNISWWGTVLYKVAVASDVSASNFAFTLDADADAAVGGIVAFRGVDVSGGVGPTGSGSGPFDVAAGTLQVTGGSSSSTITAPGITTATANAAVIMFGMIGDNNTFSNWSTTSPGTLAEILDVNSNNNPDEAAGAAWAIKSSAGATGNGTATSSSSDRNGGFLAALKAIPVLPPAQPLPIGCDGKFFVSYTPTNGSSTKLDSLGFSGATVNDYLFQTNNTNTFNGIGLSPIDGFMYGISDDGHLIKVGRTPYPVPPNNHIVQDLGAISPVPSSSVYAGCFDANGDFYYTFGTTFRKIVAANLNGSRVSTALTSLNGSGVNAPNTGTFLVDIAISPVNGKMYGVSISGTTNVNDYRLYEINIATGALTRLGNTGSNSTGQYPHPNSNFIAALFFSENGSLYGYRQDGQFLLMDLINPQSSANSGTGKAYSQADGCSCSFGSVYHTLASTPGVCPTPVNPNPTWNITVAVTNQSNAQQSGLTYTLEIPSNRFSINESAAVIANRLWLAGLLPTNSALQVTLLPTLGLIKNKIVVTNFMTGVAGSTVPFTLQLIVATPSGAAESIPLQSVISGLSALLGTTDDSDNPNTALIPNDPTIVEMCEGATLPVKLISFTGSLNNNTTSLKWVAENQVNFAYYDIERSSNSTEFTSIGTKAIQGNESSRENYQYNDNLASVNGNVFFYRLKMMDIDGAFKYSNVIMIRKDQQAITGINLSPNPLAKGETATVRFKAASATSVDFKVVDMSGRIVLTQKNNVSEGTNSVSINNLDRLQPGMYVLQMNDGLTTQMTKFNIVR